VEIREKIFKLCLTRVWNAGCRKTPALLVALRVRTELYFEALEVFNKNNFFCLKNGAKLKLFKAMPQTVLSNIRWMAIQ
jgi:hypothetical protein